MLPHTMGYEMIVSVVFKMIFKKELQEILYIVFARISIANSCLFKSNALKIYIAKQADIRRSRKRDKTESKSAQEVKEIK